MSEADCSAFLAWAAARLRLRCRGFRRVRGLPCKRMRRRVRELGLDGFDAYRAYVEMHAEEWRVIDAMCRVSISRFFRDRGVFEVLGETVLPELARRARERGDGVVRCWSVGCASGEEAYSLGLVWRIVVAPAFPELALSVLGTDADAHLIERARRGCYATGAMKELPPAWQERCFERIGDERCVRPAFREGLVFDVGDVRRGLPEGPFDVVLCRNVVFTYFDETVQREVGAGIRERLVAGGAVVIGREETMLAGLFDPWRLDAGIFGGLGP